MLGILIGRTIKIAARGMNSNSITNDLDGLADAAQEWYMQHTFNYGNRYYFKISDKEYIRAYVHVGVRTKSISKQEYIDNLQRGKVTHIQHGIDALSLRSVEYAEPTAAEVKLVMKTIKLIK